MRIFYIKFAAIPIILMVLLSVQSTAQLALDTTVTALELANEIVGPGVTVSNVTLNSPSMGAGIFSNGNTTSIGMSNGILLTTGDAYDAIGPNVAGNTSKDKPDFTADPDIDSLTNYSIKDQCILEFDFVAQSNQILVQYVFASEEYNEWVCTQYNDLFGFFVSGPNPGGGNYSGTNVALVPGTALPVSINTINNGTAGSNGNSSICESLSYSNYYVYNQNGATIGYDGYTVLLTGMIAIVPGQTYHFKFAIADISDGLWDSGIFIRADSFSIFNCQAGNISFAATPVIMCFEDNVADIIDANTSSIAPSDTYNFILTNSSGQILDINQTGVFDLALFGVGTFSVYGISYDGIVNNLTVGSNISAISVTGNTGCFELTAPLTASRVNCTPVLDCPDNVTVSCLGSVPSPNISSVTAAYQLCPGGAVTWLNDTPSGSACSGTIIRTYQFTDGCGHSALCQQTITYNDNTAPVIAGLPANANISCNATMPIGSNYAVTATDFCDASVAITSTFIDNNVGCNVARTITWTATDDCGNVATASRTFTSQDNIAPQLIGVPTNATMQCGEAVPAAVVSAIDNCDTEPNVALSATTVDNACGYSFIRTWTATDACGNSVSASQTTTFFDNIDPVLAGLPTNATVLCGQLPTAASFNVTATDACDDEVTITSSFSDAGSGCNIVRTITWTATDDCGNDVSASRTFTTSDTIAPSITGLPANATVLCGQLPIGNDYAVIANDNCDPTVTLTSSFNDVVTGCNMVRTITWTATDDCGNVATASRTFTSQDNIAPQLIGVPTNATMQCGEAVPAAVVSAIDNCDTEPNVSLSATTIDNACGYSFIRTWTATDACGNSVSASQTTTFFDNIDPVLAGLPTNATVLCGQLPTAASFNVTATDACDDEVTITSSFSDAGSGCNIVRTITWTATDDCGNDVSASRTFTTSDTIAPSITGLPANATVLCGQLPIGNDYAVIANDNCDPTVTLTSSFNDVVTGCNMVRTITWTATDDCGNVATASRTFTSQDNIAPQLIGVPTNATMQCGEAVPAAVVSAIDNCDTEPNVSLSATTVDNACGYSFIRTWTATDACGNSVSASQTTTFFDNIDPVLAGLPTNATVLCGQLPTAASFNVTATDACDDEVTITSSFSDAGSGCNIVRTITWTATDDCGNDVSASRTFTTSDDIDPVLNNLPNNGDVLCGGLPSSTQYNVTASDNCDQDVAITVDAVDVGAGCNVQRTITWTATDDCGNSVSASRTFTTQDNIAPQLIGVPTNATMQCGEAVPAAVVSAIDNCDTEPNVSLSATTIDNACGYSFIRTWTATDACGNSVSASQTTTFFDNIDPALVGLPTNATVLCGQLPTAASFNVTATDACDDEVTITSSFSDAGSGCNIVRTITWTATDNCGNDVSASRTFTTSDDIDPVLNNLPNNGDVLCGGLPSSTQYNVTASDNCDQDVAITVDAVDVGAGCNVQRTITWTATDDCGNVATASRTFTSQDNIAPQLIGVPTNATMQCGEAVPAAVVSAIDNCDTEPNVALSATTVDNACGYSFIRTWTATDACGNSVSASQTTTFFDNIDPVLAGLPTNATVLCGQLPTAASFNVTATDACDDEVTITSSFSDAGSGCNIVRTITWTATDDCGNDVSASRTFTTSDDIDPVFTNLPNNGDVLCGGLPSSTQYNVTASDNCDQDVAITVDAVDVGAGCNVQRTITWTATDDCGNSVSASRTFTTQDNIAPQLIGVPTNATMQCGEAVPAAVVSAIDNCDTEPNVALSATTVDNACGYSFIRTWTATDACGNSVSASQTTTFIDTTAPTLTGVPANAMVECSDIPAAPEVIASDNCDSELDVLFDESEIVLNSCTYQINRTWTTQDACGNSTSITQLLVVQDTTVPEILTAPLSEITIECANQELPVPPTFNDNCDEELNIEFISGISNSNNCGYDIERSWIASDNCGNSTIFTQIVHVLDTTQPTLQNVPISTTVDCSAIPAPAVVTAIDNCDTTLAVAFAEAEDASDCGKIITRTWTVSDDCGNITSATQMITVVDSNSPQVISEPADATYDCSDVIPNIQPLFIDECDTQLTVVATSDNENVGCNYLIHKTWTATDDCGNSTVVYQDITIVDNTPPVLLSAPASATVQCSSLLDAPAVIAQDNCDDDVNLEYTETQSSDCPYLITRTWTATDDCGNQTSHTQLLTVIDTEAPQLIGVPANATIQCGQPMPSAMVQAIDNCTEEPTLSLSVNTIDYECGSIMTRTWSASDACGNITTQTQTINITDNTAPILLGVPANTSANCESIPTEALVTATDNCTNEIIVEFSEVVGQGCPYIITRTWNAVDGCGNAASQSQVIMVVDETPPSFVNFPGNITINCVGTIPPATLVEASDNCDDNVVVTVTDILSDGDCGSLQRTYTATDNCGNEITGTQIINVVDQTAPQIFNIPEDITMECSDTPPAYSSDVNATDNCDNAPVITVNDVIVHHDCWHQIYRSYIATDNCGNQDSAVQVIYVLDETAPVFASHPTDLTVSCSSIPSPPELSATDNCDNTISYEYSEIASSSGCPSQIKRIWTATDDCGNTATAVQILTVVDEEAPVFDPFTVFAQVPCDQVASYTLAAHDNCDAQVEVNIIDELMLEGGCYGTIQRIYEAVDNCGNTTTAMQMIEIIDLVAPVLNNIPDDLSIDCSQNVPAPAEDIYATDNCSEGIEITFSQTQSAEFCPFDIVRTWSTTDLCGNTTSATQTIHVTVNISPIVHLKAYPNPSTIGQLRIQFSIPKDAEVSAIIFDAYGRQNKVLLDKTAEGGVLYEWTLVGDKVTLGTYTLRVMVSGEMYIERFTIIGD